MNTTTQDQDYLAGLTVLYAEDDGITRSIFTEMLQPLLGTLIVVENGEQGLAAYHEHKPRIVITDVIMPLMDGLDMAREIRRLDKSVHIIVLTAFENANYLMKAIEIGIDKYVTKPDDDFRLHETLLDCAHSLMAEEKFVEQLKQEKELLIMAKEIAEQKKLVAEAANRAKSDFLANMSHEIRTPLNSIMGMSEIIVESGLNPEQMECLAVIKTSGESLLGLIDNILDLSKIEAGMLELDSVLFSLPDCIQQLIAILTVKADSKGVTVISSMDAGIQECYEGDSLRLMQVLLNLVGNAIKFTGSGGRVNLRVEQLSASATWIDLRFTITDTGIGISPEKLSIIFNNFSQADSSTTRQYGGSGLGLAIAQRLVTMMGGDISVESTLGIGSCFSFVLRFEIPSKTLVVPQTGEPHRYLPTRPLSILIVDDNQDNRTVLKAYFRSTIHRVDCAVTGLEGVDKIKNGQYDLVLMDMEMPVMDGYTAVRNVREWERETGRTPLPVIALTANALKEDRQRSLNAGCTAHLTKPINKSHLLEAVEKYAE